MFSDSVLLHENFEVVKILYYIINALGASFYDLHVNTSKYKYFPFLYSIMFLSVYGLQIFLSISLIPKWKLSAPFAAFCIFKLCEAILPVLVIVQSFYSGKAYLKSCFEDIIFTDKLLHITGIQVDYVKMKQIVNQTFIGTNVYVLLVLGSSYLFLTYFSKNFGVLVTIALCIVETSYVFYNVYLNYFFCIVLSIFKHRFKKLNEQMQCLAEPRVEAGVSVITVKPYNPDSSILEKIKTVKSVHAIYRQNVLDHNNRFGFMILLQFIRIGTVLILCTYFLLFVFINIEASKDFFMIAVAVVTILRCTSLLLSTIVSCATTSSEANQIENFVHKILSETEDLKVLHELENFSVELIHAKVEFTAHGFFTIDYSLITKLIGSVVSYVIIFLQLGGSGSNSGSIFDFNTNQTNSNY